MNTKTITAMISIMVLAACSPKAPEETPMAELRAVKTVTVQQGPAAQRIEIPGVGAFRDETRLSFKVAGVIDQIQVREGDTVKKGQILAVLNQQEVNALVSQANAASTKAERDLARGKALRAEEVISQVQLDNLETAAQAARAQLSQSQFQKQTAQIVSPAAGVVLKRFAQNGEVVAAGQPVLLVANQSSGFVMRASLSDKQAVHVKLGDTADIEFDALANTQWPGKVIELSQAADARTGTYGVLLQVDTSAHANFSLLSGMQGRAKIQPKGSSGSRSYVPIEAVVEGDNKAAWIFTVQADKTVKRQAVQVEFIQDGQIALREALPEGTRVISTGAAYLQDGEAVVTQE